MMYVKIWDYLLYENEQKPYQTTELVSQKGGSAFQHYRKKLSCFLPATVTQIIQIVIVDTVGL